MGGSTCPYALKPGHTPKQVIVVGHGAVRANERLQRTAFAPAVCRPSYCRQRLLACIPLHIHIPPCATRSTYLSGHLLPELLAIYACCPASQRTERIELHVDSGHTYCTASFMCKALTHMRMWAGI